MRLYGVVYNSEIYEEKSTKTFKAIRKELEIIIILKKVRKEKIQNL